MDERLERYAELAVRIGANVQPGQEVYLVPAIEHVDLARALTRQAYRAGAAYVHVLYQDEHIRKAMLELGPDSALTHSPAWELERVKGMAGTHSSRRPGMPNPSCSQISTESASAAPSSSRSPRSGSANTTSSRSTGAASVRRTEAGR